MKVKKLENFQNKSGFKGCKWSSLNGQVVPFSCFFAFKALLHALAFISFRPLVWPSNTCPRCMGGVGHNSWQNHCYFTSSANNSEGQPSWADYTYPQINHSTVEDMFEVCGFPPCLGWSWRWRLAMVVFFLVSQHPKSGNSWNHVRCSFWLFSSSTECPCTWLVADLVASKLFVLFIPFFVFWCFFVCCGLWGLAIGTETCFTPMYRVRNQDWTPEIEWLCMLFYRIFSNFIGTSHKQHSQYVVISGVQSWLRARTTGGDGRGKWTAGPGTKSGPQFLLQFAHTYLRTRIIFYKTHCFVPTSDVS